MASCGQILEGTFAIIDKIRAALDRNKKGAKVFSQIGIQVRITREILDRVVKDDQRPPVPAVSAAVKLVQQRAADLEGAAQELEKSLSAGKVKAFLDEFIRADTRIEKFDKMQTELSMAQTTLITSLVVFNDNGGKSDINVSIVEKVHNCFDPVAEVNYPERILSLISERGVPLDDGTICRVSTKDLEELMQNLPSSYGKVVRIISANKLRDFSFVTAEVGNEGEGIPHVDTVIAERNDLGGDAYMAAGPISYETSAKLQTIRMSLHTLREDRQASHQALANLVPGFAGP